MNVSSALAKALFDSGEALEERHRISNNGTANDGDELGNQASDRTIDDRAFVAVHQHLVHAVVEQSRQQGWGVEKGQRVRRRWGIDHDEVDRRIGVQLP